MQVKILTGDNEVITRTICRQVGLPVGRVLLGTRNRRDVRRGAPRSPLMRPACSPRSRRRRRRGSIDALHRRGHVVGFLGDGINDGPALKAADVGVSVDTAVDIAKESADIILLEKSLAVLGEGVLEGRKIFGNITKYIKMGASSNFGNMFSVLGASIFLPFLPMQPIQVLTNNLLYDFSQTTIPTDNVDAGISCRAAPLGYRQSDKVRASLSGRSARSSTTLPISSCSTCSTAGTMRRCFRLAGSSNRC